MMPEDIPEDDREAIIKFAKRKTLDTKWVVNPGFNPQIDDIFVRLVESAIIIGCIKGYELGKKK